MLDYTIYEDRVKLILSPGRALTVYFTSDTGEVFYRWKINTVSGIQHKGIFLGRDANGIEYMIHNHYKHGRAAVVDWNTFSQNRDVFYSGETCENPRNTIIDIALDKVWDEEPYDWAKYNCQTLTNDACHNERESESVNAWVEGFKILGMAALTVGAAALIAKAAKGK